eukprot:TRINITY_DN55222_c0_g1_i1.p1 TRINITY_DN55222_c0_g1~~TRINITY_DN55222_c0_g1_i1.p1  ORF type:complete len:402 (-),score=86.98 TRINITY_DN55222_c0_g1_i1:151-1266(-)
MAGFDPQALVAQLQHVGNELATVKEEVRQLREELGRKADDQEMSGLMRRLHRDIDAKASTSQLQSDVQRLDASIGTKASVAQLTQEIKKLDDSIKEKPNRNLVEEALTTLQKSIETRINPDQLVGALFEKMNKMDAEKEFKRIDEAISNLASPEKMNATIKKLCDEWQDLWKNSMVQVQVSLDDHASVAQEREKKQDEEREKLTQRLQKVEKGQATLPDLRADLDKKACQSELDKHLKMVDSTISGKTDELLRRYKKIPSEEQLDALCAIGSRVSGIERELSKKADADHIHDRIVSTPDPEGQRFVFQAKADMVRDPCSVGADAGGGSAASHHVLKFAAFSPMAPPLYFPGVQDPLDPVFHNFPSRGLLVP